MLPAKKTHRTEQSTAFDFDAVDLEKSPKRVLKYGKLSSDRSRNQKIHSTEKKKTITSLSKGSKKPLLTLPWKSIKKTEDLSGRRLGKQRGYGSRWLVQSETYFSGKEGSQLFKALQIPGAVTTKLHLTQGFHPYPQRLHPHIPQTLLHEARKGSLLYDPFMGSGTVLLEGLLKGMRVMGSDLNPMASQITRERCRWLSLRNAQRVWTEVETIRESIESDKLGTQLVNHPYSKWLQNLYPPHLLVEMLHWFDRIGQLRNPAIRESLRTVFSSLVYRFTPNSGELRRKSRVSRGQFGRAMSERTCSLIQAQTDLSKTIRHVDRPNLMSGDFLDMSLEKNENADLLLSRPPLPGSMHHLRGQELLLKWMGIYDKNMWSNMLGTEREHLKKNWIPRFRKMMLNMRRVVAPGGKCYLFVEDWIEKGKRVDALEFLKKFSRSEGWTLDSTASRRIHPTLKEKKAYRTSGKWECLVLLRH